MNGGGLEGIAELAVGHLGYACQRDGPAGECGGVEDQLAVFDGVFLGEDYGAVAQAKPMASDGRDSGAQDNGSYLLVAGDILQAEDDGAENGLAVVEGQKSAIDVVAVES